MKKAFDQFRYLISDRFRKVMLQKNMETFLLISQEDGDA